MKVKDLEINSKVTDLKLEVVELGERRDFDMRGTPTAVMDCKAKDKTGEIVLTLWNEQIEKIGKGMTVILDNGWCKEFEGKKKVSSGKYGKLEVQEDENKGK